MKQFIKVIISGLDNAGKTSILTALNKKYNFQKEIISLTPTIRVEYQATEFLKNRVVFWDMGGQEKYRKLYQEKQDLYFADTDLLLYIVDIQDPERNETSLAHLDMILKNFKKHKMDVPLIISFHKFDPEFTGNEQMIEQIEVLRKHILKLYPSFKILFQQTSIYDIISIVQLISYGLSVFDEKFFDLSELLEKFLKEFDSESLILFDKNGIIVSEYYRDIIEPEIYVELIESIKEHLFLLKRMQEESYETDYAFSSIGDELLSYLHRIEINNESIFVSVVIKEKLKELLLEKFSEFRPELIELIEPLIKGK
ncbi:MAG TPA: ADP-ribosylation factor-like protein [Candidatus Nanopelagicaceae bacterium]|nr:ADP-ribosylation factor-like protein [Candidatus Nanopelagicaceae bacterium]